MCVNALRRRTTFPQQLNKLQCSIWCMKEKDQELMRIKYVPPLDLAYPYEIAKIPAFLDALADKTCPDDINNIIEYYNVVQYLNDGLSPLALDSDVDDHYSSFTPELYRKIGAFFKDIVSEDIDFFKNTDPIYYEELFFLIEQQDLDKRVGIQPVIKLWKSIDGSPELLLSRKRLVRDYDSIFRELIITNGKFAECLISYHFSKNRFEDIFLPKSLSDKDVLNIFKEYIQGDNPNLNYIKNIEDSKSHYGLIVDDKIKVLARRKKYELEEILFGTGGHKRQYFTIVIIQDDLDYTQKILRGENGPECYYGSSFIDRAICDVDVLHIIMAGSGSLTSDCISVVTSSQNDEGLADHLMHQGNGEYKRNFAFQFYYQNLLNHVYEFEIYMNSKGIRFEDIFLKYFNNFIEENYNISDFSFTASTLSASYLEKCKHLFTELDSIIRQFKLYMEDGKIDQDLLSISSSPVGLYGLPSCTSHKYVEVNIESPLWEILMWLFSKESFLSVASKGVHARNLGELLIENNLEFRDFHERQQERIEKLIDWGVLLVVDKYLKFRSKGLTYLLWQLYNVGALNYSHYDGELKLEIDKLVDRGWLVWKNSLLTSREEDFYSYHLNKQKYSNALELRNRYAHGVFNKEEKENDGLHYHNYIIILMLYIILINKIDDELSSHKVHLVIDN